MRERKGVKGEREGKEGGMEEREGGREKERRDGETEREEERGMWRECTCTSRWEGKSTKSTW